MLAKMQAGLLKRFSTLPSPGRKGKSFSRPTSEDNIQGSDSMVKNLDCLHQAIGGTWQRGQILVEVEQAIFEDSTGWMTMRESG